MDKFSNTLIIARVQGLDDQANTFNSNCFMKKKMEKGYYSKVGNAVEPSGE